MPQQLLGAGVWPRAAPIICSGFICSGCLQQVGPRKKALDLLATAFISGGRGAAYDLFAGLPHNETGYAAFDVDRATARMGLAPAGAAPLPRAIDRRLSAGSRLGRRPHLTGREGLGLGAPQQWLRP